MGKTVMVKICLAILILLASRVQAQWSADFDDTIAIQSLTGSDVFSWSASGQAYSLDYATPGTNYSIVVWTNKVGGSLTLGASKAIEVLVVGGGGGAGRDIFSSVRSGGGGGAGGYIYTNAYLVNKGITTIAVGTGGINGGSGSGNVASGSNGLNSSIGSLVAHGGGGGAGHNLDYSTPWGTVGSGGSGGAGSSAAASAGTGTAGEGNNGGTGFDNGSSWNGGGGGGALSAGANAVAGSSGNGGNGRTNLIGGERAAYAGGGGGVGNTGPKGSGGVGGGGGVGTNGTNGTGGGGGAGRTAAGRGGDGIVIVRIPTGTNAFASIPGLLLHLKLNDSNGTTAVVDSGPSNKTVTATTTTSSFFSTGKVNSCFDFPASRYATVTQPITAGAGSTMLSITMWVKIHAARDAGLLWARPSSSAYGMGQSADGSFSFFVVPPGAGQAAYGPILPTETWVHLAATWGSGDYVRLYTNGVAAGLSAGTYTGGLGAALANWTLGYDTLGSYANAAMDDVRMYYRQLSQAEVQSIYNGGTGIEAE